MKIIKNNDGVTLIELLTVIVLSGFISITLFSLISFSSRSNILISSELKIKREADIIMNSIRTTIANTDEAYIKNCSNNENLCIEIVSSSDIIIDPIYGIIDYEKEAKITKIEIKDNLFYFNDINYTDADYIIVSEKSSITINCLDSNKTNLCQEGIIEFQLTIRDKKNNDNEITYINRFSY